MATTLYLKNTQNHPAGGALGYYDLDVAQNSPTSIQRYFSDLDGDAWTDIYLGWLIDVSDPSAIGGTIFNGSIYILDTSTAFNAPFDTRCAMRLQRVAADATVLDSYQSPIEFTGSGVHEFSLELPNNWSVDEILLLSLMVRRVDTSSDTRRVNIATNTPESVLLLPDGTESPVTPLETPSISVITTVDPSDQESSDGSATISWDAVQDASAYRVEIAEGSNVSTGFTVLEEDFVGTSYTVSELGEGEFTVAVTAKP